MVFLLGIRDGDDEHFLDVTREAEASVGRFPVSVLDTCCMSSSSIGKIIGGATAVGDVGDGDSCGGVSCGEGCDADSGGEAC